MRGSFNEVKAEYSSLQAQYDEEETANEPLKQKLDSSKAQLSKYHASLTQAVRYLRLCFSHPSKQKQWKTENDDYSKLLIEFKKQHETYMRIHPHTAFILSGTSAYTTISAPLPYANYNKSIFFIEHYSVSIVDMPRRKTILQACKKESNHIPQRVIPKFVHAC